MTRANDAMRRLTRETKGRLRAEVHAERDAFAVLDVEYLYRLLAERVAALGDALTADGNPEAAIDQAYVDRVWRSAGDAAIALAFLADRVTPRDGLVIPSSEHRGATFGPRPERE